jgi:hypothetical protein
MTALANNMNCLRFDGIALPDFSSGWSPARGRPPTGKQDNGCHKQLADMSND